MIHFLLKVFWFIVRKCTIDKSIIYVEDINIDQHQCNLMHMAIIELFFLHFMKDCEWMLCDVMFLVFFSFIFAAVYGICIKKKQAKNCPLLKRKKKSNTCVKVHSWEEYVFHTFTLFHKRKLYFLMEIC